MIILLPDNKRKKQKRKGRKEKQKGAISEFRKTGAQVCPSEERL